MKDNLNDSGPSSGMPFLLAQSPGQQANARPKLAGFAKVLAGGRVVGLKREAPFVDRMIGFDIGSPPGTSTSKPVEQLILESVATNLEAGVKMLDKQELALAQMGGRLSGIALALNRAREIPEGREESQVLFERARNDLRNLSKETFDHTALFSMGASKPIVVAVPSRKKWVGLCIDRCDLVKPGLQSIDRGKVSPSATGLLLDPESISLAFDEWRSHCASNRLQWNLIYTRWQDMVSTLKHFLGGRKWVAPPFPDDTDKGPLSRPHLDN